MSINAQNTLWQLQNNTNQVNWQNAQKNLGTGKLDRDGFLRLIMAQLQYQDPTEPQNDATQMLTQQIQLEQADQMKEMVTASRFSQAAGMVGKTAELIDARWNFNTGMSDTPAWDVENNQPKSVTGVIESVQFDRTHDKALIKINGNYYDAEKIMNIYATAPTAPNNSSGGQATNNDSSGQTSGGTT